MRRIVFPLIFLTLIFFISCINSYGFFEQDKKGADLSFMSQCFNAKDSLNLSPQQIEQLDFFLMKKLKRNHLDAGEDFLGHRLKMIFQNFRKICWVADGRYC